MRRPRCCDGDDGVLPEQPRSTPRHSFPAYRSWRRLVGHCVCPAIPTLSEVAYDSRTTTGWRGAHSSVSHSEFVKLSGVLLKEYFQANFHYQ